MKKEVKKVKVVKKPKKEVKVIASMETINGEEYTVTRDLKGVLISKSII